jgi:hypothetical protein
MAESWRRSVLSGSTFMRRLNRLGETRSRHAGIEGAFVEDDVVFTVTAGSPILKSTTFIVLQPPQASLAAQPTSESAGHRALPPC